MFKIYKQNIIDALEALSSYQFQQIAWFENNQGLCYSYNENVLDLFYDSSLDDALKNGETVFGKNTDNFLKDLESEIAKIDGDDFTEEELLNMPQMQTIRNKATNALALVKASDGKESTVEIVE